VYHKQKKRHYVLKAIPLTDPKETETAQKEVKMLQLFNNPFIVRYSENFIDKQQFCIVMEYCDNGDLNGYFEVCKAKRLLIPQPQVLDWFTQIAFGLEYIHSQKVLHRDIKAQNIFLTKQGLVKLGFVF
jgi:NIMA (never in mitosis gene a)-related kinase